LPDWRQELNDRQFEAVTHPGGPLLILAGAGSGKTRALTYRIAYLIYELGVSPYEILAITFTNKAAQEMKQRVRGLLPDVGEGIWVATFHSTCARILRREAAAAGLNPDFAIYDTSDQRQLVKDILSELRWEPKKFAPQAFLATISQAKNELIGPDRFAAQAAMRPGDAWAERVARVYRMYQRRLAQNNALDFDDLLAKAVELFEGNEDVLARYQERFRHILVDEYQDTNHAQYRLVKALATRHRNLTVVGDDDQSIYAFRGADTRNILEYERDWPEAKVVKLEQNYRSTVTILEAANSLVGHNDYRKVKRLWTQNPEGEPLRYYQATDQRDEAVHVALQLARMRDEGVSLGDSVVLYRTNAQSRLVEEALGRMGLPYQIVGGLRFYDRKEIKDIVAYLRLVVNPADGVSLQRVINEPKRGVGPVTWTKLVELAERDSITPVAAMARAGELGGVAARTRQELAELALLLDDLHQHREALGPARALATLLQRTGYRAALVDERTIEAQGRLDNLDEFERLASEHEQEAEDPSLIAFLERVALVADIDSLDDAPDRVVLMTVHTAKGLEFGSVFVIGLDEGIFPHQRSLGLQTELEEERRLCYVAMTRAQQRLFLSSASARVGFGGQAEPLRPSRFLGEVPTNLVRVSSPGGMTGGRELIRQSAGGAGGRRVTWQEADRIGKAVVQAAPPGPTKIAEGDLPRAGERVRHAKWGEGTVIAVKGSGADAEITVAFPDLGIKRLMAGYARLERLGSSGGE
jgi:DNA helicase-2/ATP-dependent DNA helicase PcrA